MSRTISMSALLGSLSLSTDAANGVRPATALRTAVLATELAMAAGLATDVVRTVYWTALLRFVGCTSFAFETSRLAAGDDRALLAALQTVDAASPGSVLSRALEATQGKDAFARVTAVGRLVASPSIGRELAEAHCAQADSLASLLEVDESVRAALQDLYERWDGLGQPRRKRGDAIHLAARVVHVAATAEAQAARYGPETAREVISAMAGRALDPSLVAWFEREATQLVSLERRVFERALELEPEPRWICEEARERDVLTAFARYVDLKSPFTLGHSTGVASLVERVGAAMGLEGTSLRTLVHAALVHDLGRVAVSNGIWDGTEPLGHHEREQIRSHAHHTERILSAVEATREVCAIASETHERADENGYPRGRAPRSLEARILAASDVATALGEARPHRPARERAAREAELRREVEARRLDANVVDAVLAVLRGSTPIVRRDALSEREVQVLALLARGASNKEIAASLAISPKTVQHHVAHLYDKTGVRSRAAAALFAVERGLVAPSR